MEPERCGSEEAGDQGRECSATKRTEAKITRCEKFWKERYCYLYVVNVHFRGKDYATTIAGDGGRPTHKAILDKFFAQLGTSMWVQY